jgi:CheY-like chemotaxis protein
MKTPRLLLVDDNQDNLEILTVILRDRYHVSSHVCPQEALVALEAAQPDLVLLDIAMTPVDGLQCLAAIRAIPGYDRIPAIALTAYAHDVERQAFLSGGFQAVVTKPILDPQQLFGPIDALLAHAAPPPGGRTAGDQGADRSGLSALVSGGACSAHQVKA